MHIINRSTRSGSQKRLGFPLVAKAWSGPRLSSAAAWPRGETCIGRTFLTHIVTMNRRPYKCRPSGHPSPWGEREGDRDLLQPGPQPRRSFASARPRFMERSWCCGEAHCLINLCSSLFCPYIVEDSRSIFYSSCCNLPYLSSRLTPCSFYVYSVYSVV
jgi:hypothetical protein